MSINGFSATLELPMERPLYHIPVKPKITNIRLEAGDESVDSSALYEQVVVDKTAIAQHIRQSLQVQSQLSLRDLCQTRPLQQGLAELLAYLELGEEGGSKERFEMLVDEDIEELIYWSGEDGRELRARMPRIIYLRPSS